jgi:hypothetical protein
LEDRPDYTALGWNILFGEDYESIPDPNKPENTAVLNARSKVIQRYDRMTDRAKKRLLQITTSPIDLTKCNCVSCLLIKDTQSIFQILLEAQEVIQLKNKD